MAVPHCLATMRVEKVICELCCLRWCFYCIPLEHCYAILGCTSARHLGSNTLVTSLETHSNKDIFEVGNVHGLLAFSRSAGPQALACCVACKWSGSGQASLSIWFKHLEALSMIRKACNSISWPHKISPFESNTWTVCNQCPIPFFRHLASTLFQWFEYGSICIPPIPPSYCHFCLLFAFKVWLHLSGPRGIIYWEFAELGQQYSELVILGIDSSLGPLASKWIM